MLNTVELLTRVQIYSSGEEADLGEHWKLSNNMGEMKKEYVNIPNVGYWSFHQNIIPREKLCS